MANVAAAFGGRPVRHRNGAPYNGAYRTYYSAGASALYIGDPVVISTGAGNQAAYYGSPIGSLMTVVLATAATANAIAGFIVGFYPEQATSTVYGANGVGRGVFVADDPNLIFEIMDDGVVASTYAFAGSAGNLNLTTYSGSTATGRSGATLSTTLGNAAGDQFKILGLAERPNNAVGANAVWEVMINNHSLTPSVVGATL